MSKKRVSIIIPITHTVPGDWFVNFLSFMTYNMQFFELDIKASSWYLTAESRNNGIRKSLMSDSKPDYLFFLDGDNMPKPNTIMQLMHAGKDIISALYFERKPPFYPVIRMLDKNGMFYTLTEIEPNTVMRVDAAGAGCLLVKRKVFEKIPEPWFRVEEDEKGRLLGEDVYFFMKARKYGFKAYVDTSCICPHWGAVIDEKPWKYYHDRGMYEKNKPNTPKLDLTKECKKCELVNSLWDTLAQDPELQLLAYNTFKKRIQPKSYYEKFVGEE